MKDETTTTATRDIVVEDVLPHAPATVWQALTSGAMIARWMMPPEGFAPVKGTRFTFQTTPAGAWDGVIDSEVLEAEPNRRLAYAWKAGHEANAGGYGSRLDTVVTFTLTAVEAGTRLRVVHSGFVLPANASAFTNMGGGWKTVVTRIAAAIDAPN